MTTEPTDERRGRLGAARRRPPTSSPAGTGGVGIADHPRPRASSSCPRLALWAYLALVASPADVNQGEVVRLLYVHVPSWSWPTSPASSPPCASAVLALEAAQWWDLVAASVGRDRHGHGRGHAGGRQHLRAGPTWGVYWTWDARLTATAMLMLLLLGYLAVRRIPAERRGPRPPLGHRRRCCFVPNIIVVNQSVDLVALAPPGPTLFRLSLSPKIDGLMLFTLVYSLRRRPRCSSSGC